MPQRRPVVLAVAAAVGVVAAVALTTQATGGGAGQAPRSGQGPTGSAAGASATPSASPSAEAAGPGAASSTASVPTTEGPTAAPTTAPTGAADGLGGIEVLPDQPAETPLARLAADDGPAPWPAGSSDGAVDVSGDVPVAPRSRVGSQTRSTEGSRVQVALVARGADRAERVLRFYRVRLGELGFSQAPVPAVAGSTAAGFRRGSDSVVVTVTPRPAGGTDYSVLATWGA